MGRVWFVVAILAFLAAVAYVVVVAITSADLTNASDDAPLLILAVVGAVSLAGWWRDRARTAALQEKNRLERERLEDEVGEKESALRETRELLGSVRKKEEEQRRTRHELESRLKEREQALNRERYLRTRSEDSRRSEKEWSRELQAEVMRLYRERGTLGDPSDVPSMVLRLAKTLLEADKGLLLSRRDEDEDGDLDLIAADGFERDPSNSALVQRFAAEVIERDTIVRENRLPDVAAESRTPTDEEIENLVAIPIYLQDRFSGVVVCANREGGFDDYDEDVLLSLGDHAGAVLQNARLRGELRGSYLATVSVLADAMEAKDPFLRSHSEEVSSYVAAVADRLPACAAGTHAASHSPGDPLPPRALRRERLPFGAAGRRDPAGSPDHLCGRRLQRDD